MELMESPCESLELPPSSLLDRLRPRPRPRPRPWAAVSKTDRIKIRQTEKVKILAKFMIRFSTSNRRMIAYATGLVFISYTNTIAIVVHSKT